MSKVRGVGIPFGFIVVFASGVAAQTHSPYVQHTGRSIKALSDEEIAALQAGEGMSLALPAELNGYPGPRHALELADSLALNVEQRRRTRALFDAMQAEARRLGDDIVTREARLDSAFADRTISDQALRRHLDEIADARARLRFVHLVAHLRLTALLTEHQIHTYQRLRGYGGHTGH